MIDEPGLQLCATPAREWSADGPLSSRVLEFARSFALGITFASEGERSAVPLIPQHFLVGRAAPEHVGLGTGTQLGLATGRLLAEVCGLRADTSDLARRVGRGLRSGLGVHGFERGGFLVEAGKSSTALAPLVAHSAFPEDWRIVLVIPPHHVGLHGVPEKEAFTQLAAAPTNRDQTDALCRLTLLGMLPALQEHDVQAFGEGYTNSMFASASCSRRCRAVSTVTAAWLGLWSSCTAKVWLVSARVRGGRRCSRSSVTRSGLISWRCDCTNASHFFSNRACSSPEP